MITIVTPSYNQGKFIRETIDSVLNQETDCIIEHIVMDGGSKDETIDILSSYGDRIKWVSETDNGQADAVNKGFKIAKGSIIGWLNSDDIYYTNAFAKVLEIFNNHPGINIVYGNADHVDQQSNFIEEYYTQPWNYKKLKDICYICQPAVFFRKKIVEEYGLLDQDLNYCMDYEYWLRIGKKEEFYYLPEKLAGSRLYMDNKTLGSRIAVHQEIVEMFKLKFKEIPPRWIYNLAHVLADEKKYNREIPAENLEYTLDMISNAVRVFFKYYKYVPLQEMKNMFVWYLNAKRRK